MTVSVRVSTILRESLTEARFKAIPVVWDRNHDIWLLIEKSVRIYRATVRFPCDLGPSADLSPTWADDRCPIGPHVSILNAFPHFSTPLKCFNSMLTIRHSAIKDISFRSAQLYSRLHEMNHFWNNANQLQTFHAILEKHPELTICASIAESQWSVCVLCFLLCFMNVPVCERMYAEALFACYVPLDCVDCCWAFDSSSRISPSSGSSPSSMSSGTSSDAADSATFSVSMSPFSSILYKIR